MLKESKGEKNIYTKEIKNTVYDDDHLLEHRQPPVDKAGNTSKSGALNTEKCRMKHIQQFIGFSKQNQISSGRNIVVKYLFVCLFVCLFSSSL